MPKSAVTLLEILTVIIIVAILAALAMVNFGGAKEKALNREAIANLRLIAAAERIYRMEYTTYFGPANNASTINNNLKLSLNTGSTGSWDYAVVASTSNTFNISATRKTLTCTYSLDQIPNTDPGGVGATCD